MKIPMRWLKKSGPVLVCVFLTALAAQAQTHHTGKAPAELGTSAAIAPDGSWYAVTSQDGHVVLHHSHDEGRTWTRAATVNREPEAIAADGENRPRIAFADDGAVLVSWARRFEKRFTGDVRFARAADGRHFDAPVTVHQDRGEIGHSFNSMLVLPSGAVLVAWIDGRDRKIAEASETDYRGSAIYVAVSEDGGRSFRPEVKVADHGCQCCRLALAVDTDDRPLILWRHVFEPNERDHALAKLDPGDGTPVWIRRATFDGWKIDACPHHGPSLTLDEDGRHHAVWFNQVGENGNVFYGRLGSQGVENQRNVGGPRAAHADIASAGTRLAIAWKEFDGERTQLMAMTSDDGGQQFHTLSLASTAGPSDQPRLLTQGERMFVFWRTEQEGMQGYPLP